MDIEADEYGAPSSSEKALRHLETRVPDSYLTILSRALLINSLEKFNAATVTNFLALSPLAFAHQAIQCGTEAESEWVRVGSLEVELRRDWLLFESHVTHLYLDLFRKRGPATCLPYVGRVCVPEVEQIMRPTWIRAFRTPVITNEGLLEATPDCLSWPCYPCQEPPRRRRFLDERSGMQPALVLDAPITSLFDAALSVVVCLAATGHDTTVAAVTSRDYMLLLSCSLLASPHRLIYFSEGLLTAEK
ncbi:hypothetical protein COCOBI_08-0750 [Coccomyxa sp. Obi]|nr:hypothetical protein COCOBI_08-0750 [Coccomyxa sp. Obi]